MAQTLLNQWRAENPLRQWLVAKRAQAGRDAPSIKEIAAKVGVCRQVVHYWLRGLHFPSDRSIEAIENVTGIGCVEWYLWRRRRPRGRKKGGMTPPTEG